MSAAATPLVEHAARMLAMPADTNSAGDIFGCWIMSLERGALRRMRRKR